VNVTGILVQFGRGMIQDVSNQMLARFTEAMRAPARGGRLPAARFRLGRPARAGRDQLVGGPALGASRWL
jgi:hypothetical protein